MNTLALSEYIREVAEENPLLDWSEERPLLPEDEKLLQKLEWLQESDEQNRGFYQTEMDNEKEREDLRYGKKEAQSLREYLLFQIHLLPVCEKEKKVLSFLAESTEESGYLETDALEAAMERYHLDEQRAEEILGHLQKLDPPGVGARDSEGMSEDTAHAERRFCGSPEHCGELFGGYCQKPHLLYCQEAAYIYGRNGRSLGGDPQLRTKAWQRFCQ